MKQKISFCLLLVVVFMLGSSPVRSAADEELVFSSDMQKESYSLGYEFGGHLRRQTLDADLDVIMAGISDAYGGRQPKLTLEEMKRLIGDLKRKVWTSRQKMYREKAAASSKASEAFLAANAKRPHVITLPSGLQYMELKQGSGPVPKPSDTVTVHYRGTLIDGTEIDNSYDRGEPSTVHVFGVIQGWSEALQRMKTGAKWRIFVPSALAYGKRRFGRIPPNSALIFDIELLSISQVPVGSAMRQQPAAPQAGSP